MAERYPWEDWDEKKRAEADKTVGIMDAIKTYRNAGRLGVMSERADDSRKLAAQGGLSPDEATWLARYKQYKQITGGDPAWQGPLQINAGAPDPIDTKADVDARQRKLLSAKTQEERDRLGAQAADLNARSGERFYDDLVTPELAAHKDEPKRKPTAALGEAEALRKSVSKTKTRRG